MRNVRVPLVTAAEDIHTVYKSPRLDGAVYFHANPTGGNSFLRQNHVFTRQGETGGDNVGQGPGTRSEKKTTTFAPFSQQPR
jgi:hypothetical protein